MALSLSRLLHTSVHPYIGGPDNDTLAFGRLVAVSDVVEAIKIMDQNDDKVPHACAAHLLRLVEAGMMRLLDDIDLGGW